MLARGLLNQVTRPGDGGPAKNVLSVTPQGLAALVSWREQWRDFNARVSHLLEASSLNDPRKGASDD